NLRTAVGNVDVASSSSGKLAWRVGAEISHRNLRTAASQTVLSLQFDATGYELKQHAELNGVLWRVPERRFKLTAGITSGAARLWSASPENFEKLTGSMGWQWYPQARGDD